MLNFLHRLPDPRPAFAASAFRLPPSSARVSAFCFLLSAFASALLFTACATPHAFVEPAPLNAGARAAHNAETFDRTWQLVNDKYFDPHFRGVDWSAMPAKYRAAAVAAADDTELYDILDQMCAELHESHLTPLPPQRSYEIRTDHRIAVGMVWRILDGRRIVTEVIPDGPAAEHGVQPGWVLLARNGVSLDDDIAPYRASSDVPVTYSFLDLANQARTIEFIPELLRIQRNASSELAGGYRYLRFDKFDQQNLHWLSQELKVHRDAPGVVLDLRENPGGYLFAFRLAIGEFFNHRVPTGEFVRRNGRATEERGLSFLSAKYPGRVVILTGAATGSAAEIFTHILQYQGRATVIGRRTAGAVIVARNFPLPGGGELQVPIQDYRGLDGRRLEGHGVIPDIGVPLPALDDIRAGRDPDIEAALATLAHAPSPRTNARPIATLR